MRNTNDIPIDRVAARVMSSGEHFTPKGVDESVIFDELPSKVEIEHSPSFIDLTGQTFGRLEVIYYIGNGRWLLRCNCGQYTKRATGIIKRHVNEKREAMCDICDKRNRLKGPTRYEMTGADVRAAVVTLQKQVADIQAQLADFARLVRTEAK